MQCSSRCFCRPDEWPTDEVWNWRVGYASPAQLFRWRLDPLPLCRLELIRYSFFFFFFFFFGYISISLSSFIQCYQLTLINWLSSNYRYWFTVVIVVSSATRSFVCSWFSKGINWDSFIDSKSQGSFMGFTAWYASITTVIEDSLTWQQGAGIEGEATAIYP